jgi:hypothetical protein
VTTEPGIQFSLERIVLRNYCAKEPVHHNGVGQTCDVAPARNGLIALRPVNRAGLPEPARTLRAGGLVVPTRRHWIPKPRTALIPTEAIVTAKGWGRGRQANADSRAGGCIV